MAAKKKTTRRRLTCGSKTGGTRVQSLAFSKTKHTKSKPKWTPTRARKWAEAHGYKATKVDVTPSEYRLRQHAPKKACGYRSVPFGQSGIRAVMELPAHVRRAVDEEMVRGRR